jgi:hypothetical protein
MRCLSLYNRLQVVDVGRGIFLFLFGWARHRTCRESPTLSSCPVTVTVRASLVTPWSGSIGPSCSCNQAHNKNTKDFILIFFSKCVIIGAMRVTVDFGWMAACESYHSRAGYHIKAGTPSLWATFFLDETTVFGFPSRNFFFSFLLKPWRNLVRGERSSLVTRGRPQARVLHWIPCHYLIPATHLT